MQRLPHIPVRLLVSTKFSGMERGAFEPMLRRLRQDWLKLAPAPRIHEVAGSSHYIQKEKPQAVLDAIDFVAASSTAALAPPF
jgi:hypothetical protein